MPVIYQHRNWPPLLHVKLFHRSVLVRAIISTSLGFLACPPATFAQEAVSVSQEAKSARYYDLPAGALTDSLNRFGREAGILLSFSTELTNGLQSQRLSGSYSVSEGLEHLLSGTGLDVAQAENGSYSLRRAPVQTEAQLRPVKVIAVAEGVGIEEEGSANAGYRVKTVSSVGALGSRSLQDTPFSISVISQQLLQNIQAQSPDDIYKLNPSTRTTAPQIAGWSPMVNIRGFSTYDTAEDGLRRAYNHAATVEDKARVEVLNGLSGFLYGASAPGGMVNYVYKRPTIERLNSVTVGNYGGSQYFIHGDFGGRIDEEGRAGYRLNVVKQDGDTAVDDQTLTRELASGAFDWQLTEQLLLELNAVYNHYRTDGASAYWYYEVPHGSAPNASKLWSQPWISDEFDNTKVMGKFIYQLNEHITLRGASMRDFVDRPKQDHTMNDVTSATEFEQIRIRSGETKDTYDASQLLADIAFDTGALAHQLTVGYTMYSDASRNTPYNPNTGYRGPYPVTSPTYVPEPSFPPDDSSPYYAGRIRNENYLIGDTIAFSQQWSTLLGLSHSSILSNGFDESGARNQPDYDKSRNSPSASLVYKPVPWLTSYVSYIEGLEQGGVAPDEANNSGDILAPMVSRQREIGVKATVGGVLLTTALFEIEKAYEYTNSNNVYTQSGRQNHKGIELNATGKVSDNLTVISGVTWLDTKIDGGDFDGNEPMNVANLVAKLYSEYALPFAPDLSVTGGLYYTGKQWANDANTDRLPAFTTIDLGMRYTTTIANRMLVLRMNVDNLTDKNYWLNSYYVGSPRSVAFSAQLQF